MDMVEMDRLAAQIMQEKPPRRELRRREEATLSDLSSLDAETVQRLALRKAEERNKTCPHCGKLFIPELRTYTVSANFSGSRNRTAWVWPSVCGCPGEVETAVKAEEQRRVQAEFEAIIEKNRALDSAGLVGILRGCTFDSFEIRADWEPSSDVLARVTDYSSHILSGHTELPFLVLHGTNPDHGCGTGKTHLAAAVMHQAIEVGWRNVYLRVWPTYLRRLLTISHGRDKNEDDGETEADLIDELTKGRLVVIDDIDKRHDPSGWAREILYDVLNERWNMSLPTILTMNSHPERAGQWISAAVLDRIVQHAFDTICFDGPSYRWKDH